MWGQAEGAVGIPGEVREDVGRTHALSQAWQTNQLQSGRGENGRKETVGPLPAPGLEREVGRGRLQRQQGLTHQSLIKSAEGRDTSQFVFAKVPLHTV